MRFIISLILSIIIINVSAQSNKQKAKQLKSDIATVKTALKKGNDLEKSETTIRKYLADSAYHDNHELHMLLVEAVHKQYLSYNEKMYLKQSVDTAKMIQTGVRLFIANETRDSLEMKMLKDNSDTPPNRKKYAEAIMPFRDNILKGSQYYFIKNNWDEAWTTADTYLDCLQQPLFSAVAIDTTRSDYAAFIATMAAINKQNLTRATKYVDMALAYQPRREMLLEKMATLCQAKNDTARFEDYVKTGLREYPQSPYFFTTLIDHLNEKGNYDEALSYADAACREDSTNMTALLARHNALMLTSRYDKALDDGLRLLAANDSLPMPNYNVGLIYYMRGQSEMKRTNIPLRQRMKLVQKQYKAALPYMERYRNIAKDDKEHWQPILYEIYLNLNMGKEFENLTSDKKR